MIDVVFKLNSMDFHSKLSTYQVSFETTFQNLFTTMDGTEHGQLWKRPIISFTLIPMTDSQASQLFTELSKPTITVQYTNPHTNGTSTGVFRIASNLEAVFGLRSVDGNRYYKGSKITLRSLGVT